MKRLDVFWAPLLYQTLFNALHMLFHVMIELALKYIKSTSEASMASRVWSELTGGTSFSQHVA